MLFLERLDRYIVRSVRRLYTTALERFAAAAAAAAVQPETAAAGVQPAKYGYLYVFRDARDEEGVYKIGSTQRTAETRVAEWRAQLAAATGQDGAGAVMLVFAQRVPSPLLTTAEKVVHALLFCQWLPRRVNRGTGLRLTEYFAIDDLRALRLLLRAVVEHVTWQFRAVLRVAR